MNSLTQAIVEEGKNQLTNTVGQTATVVAQNTTPQLSLLSSLPWPIILILVIISLFLAWQLLKFLKWLFRMVIVVGLGSLVLYGILKIIT